MFSNNVFEQMFSNKYFRTNIFEQIFSKKNLQVKRAAVAEVQKAMALAEKRALDSVAEERIKMERILMEATNNNNNNNNSGNSNNKYTSETLGHSENVEQAAKDQVGDTSSESITVD
jgi:hypothetical protein